MSIFAMTFQAPPGNGPGCSARTRISTRNLQLPCLFHQAANKSSQLGTSATCRWPPFWPLLAFSRRALCAWPQKRRALFFVALPPGGPSVSALFSVLLVSHIAAFSFPFEGGQGVEQRVHGGLLIVLFSYPPFKGA